VTKSVQARCSQWLLCMYVFMHVFIHVCTRQAGQDYYKVGEYSTDVHLRAAVSLRLSLRLRLRLI